MNDNTQKKIFVSYKREDREFTLKLAKALTEKGIHVWIDLQQITAGERWDAEVQKALEQSEILIVILSPASVASQNVMDEVSYAITNKKRIIPVKVKECSIPFRLDRLHFIDFTEGYEAAFMELSKTLDIPPPPPPVPLIHKIIRWIKVRKKIVLWTAGAVVVIIGAGMMLLIFTSNQSCAKKELSLINPPDGTEILMSGKVIDFKWGECPDATQYIFSLRSDSATIVNEAVTGAGYKFNIPDNLLTKALFWKVRNKKNDQQGPWSNEYKITVGEQLIPTLIAPEDHSRIVINNPVVFDWSDCPGAEEYEVRIEFPPNTREPMNTKVTDLLPLGGIKSERKFMFNNAYGPGHRWRVRAKINGQWREWSEKWSFFVAPH